MKKTMLAAMVAALVCVAVVLGIYPADRTVWCVEMVWAVGLWAILLLTRRKFRFSKPAYLCFFVWTVLCDTLGAICASTLFLLREKR
jgi:uncharacterized membrane protein YjdF